MYWFKKLKNKLKKDIESPFKAIGKLEKKLENGLHTDLKDALHGIEVDAINAKKEGRALAHGIEVDANNAVKFGGKLIKTLVNDFPPVLLAKFLIKEGKHFAQAIHDSVDKHRKSKSAQRAADALEALQEHEKEVALENAIAAARAKKGDNTMYYAIGGVVALLVLIIIIKKLKK